MVTSSGKIPSSFRDPRGLIFNRHNTLYRKTNHSYRESCDVLMSSGLYLLLVDKLLLDLTSPSPAIGWGNAERDSLAGRGPADCVMALALIHHIAIGNSVRLKIVASFMHSITHDHLIIEFVPKSDSQIKRLPVGGENIFDSYDQEHFEKAFSPDFEIRNKVKIRQTERTMYLMKARS